MERLVGDRGRKPVSTTRDLLADRATAYLAALDRLEIETVLSFFAQDAVLSVRTGDLAVAGAPAIREMWKSFFRSHERMEHRVTNVVADEIARKAATEQEFTGVLRNGTREERCSAYFFVFDERDLFVRVIVWIDGETPVRV